MKVTPGSISSTTDDVTTEDVLLAYDEAEKQQNEINSANASLVFEPTFIPVFPTIQRNHELTDTEAKLYGFIWFYLSNANKRFYFTNEQLSRVLCCSEASVKRAVKTLQDKALCKFSYRVKANGGTIRFVNGFPTGQSVIPTGHSDPSDGSKRPAIDNKINNISLSKERDSQQKSSEKSEKSSHPYQEIVEYCRTKQGMKTNFVNYPKQMAAVKRILSSGYTIENIRFVIDEMADDPRDSYWRDNTFDLMNVANQIHKYMNRTVMFGKGGGKRVSIS